MGNDELTEAQLNYLVAFDLFLAAPTFSGRFRARMAMAERLNFVLAERNLPLPDDIRWEPRDPPPDSGG